MISLDKFTAIDYKFILYGVEVVILKDPEGDGTLILENGKMAEWVSSKPSTAYSSYKQRKKRSHGNKKD